MKKAVREKSGYEANTGSDNCIDSIVLWYVGVEVGRGRLGPCMHS